MVGQADTTSDQAQRRREGADCEVRKSTLTRSLMLTCYSTDVFNTVLTPSTWACTRGDSKTAAASGAGGEDRHSPGLVLVWRGAPQGGSRELPAASLVGCLMPALLQHLEAQERAARDAEAEMKQRTCEALTPPFYQPVHPWTPLFKCIASVSVLLPSGLSGRWEASRCLESS